MCQFIYREFTPIKIFLGQSGIVLVKEGGHTLQFQQPRT